jgi:phage tail sheath protein FI
MAATYQTPGVHVEEIPTLPATIVPVATAIPAFVGRTQKALDSKGVSLVGVPTRITSLAEYVVAFGGPQESITINVSAAPAITSNSLGYLMFLSVQLYFLNGGGPCYICSSGTGYSTAVTDTELADAIDALEKADEPTLLVLPEASSINYNPYSAALTHCHKMGDRFFIMDVPVSSGLAGDASSFRDDFSMEGKYLQYGAAYYPNLNCSYSYPNEAILLTGLGAGKDDRSLAVALQEIAENDPDAIAAIVMPKLSAIRTLIAGIQLTLPASPAIAGLYARVDRDRGVWKAPANEPLLGVSSPTIKMDDDENAILNVDSIFGKSINGIRKFNGRGTLVWGSRTLLGNDAEWRYVPVRRLFLMVEESISKALQGVVFEPNDANTWIRVKGMVGNFLNGLWKSGAIAGAKPQEAYFVRVGLGETMDSNDILNGLLNVEIGIAAVRPAEFIILRFSHKLQIS